MSSQTEQQETPGFQILRAIRRIIRKTSQYSRAVGKQAGVSIPQMLCLKTIGEMSDCDEITVVKIAQAVQMSPPTVSRILDRLEKAEYIHRERDSKDRRRVRVMLTDAGRSRLDDLPTPLHERFLERLEQLDPMESREMLTALERIVELMDAEKIDASPVLAPETDLESNQPMDEEAKSGRE